MTPAAQRRQEDLRRLRVLEGQSKGRVRIDQVSGDPMTRVTLTLAVPTAASAEFPAKRIPEVRVMIDLPTDYPFTPPECTVLDPVLNVNIFQGGRVCLGSQWMPSHQLSLTLARLWRILSLDPEVINPNSPANSAALDWWQSLLRQHRHILPTASRLVTEEIAKPTLGWKPIR